MHYFELDVVMEFCMLVSKPVMMGINSIQMHVKVTVVWLGVVMEHCRWVWKLAMMGMIIMRMPA